MNDRESLRLWTTDVASRFGNLSGPAATVLAMWSFGTILAKSSATTAVCSMLAALGLGREDALRQRLREWSYDAEDKRGTSRRSVDERACFAPLMKWIASLWVGDRVALAMDATSIGNRFVVLCVSVVFRGCAIPAAWTTVRADRKGAWNPRWRALLARVREGFPREAFIVVSADRGLYSKDLFERAVRLGLHPLFRVNSGGTFRPDGEPAFRPLSSFAAANACGAVRGTAFTTKPLQCTLLFRRDAVHEDDWLVLTDLPPEAADVAWYALRSWIEVGFKLAKRAGWRIDSFRTTDPRRFSRRLLVVAVATLWVVSTGAAVEDEPPALDRGSSTPRRGAARSRPRRVGVFRRGLAALLAALVRGRPWPAGRLAPEPWPVSNPPPILLTGGPL